MYALAAVVAVAAAAFMKMMMIIKEANERAKRNKSTTIAISTKCSFDLRIIKQDATTTTISTNEKNASQVREEREKNNINVHAACT